MRSLEQGMITAIHFPPQGDVKIRISLAWNSGNIKSSIGLKYKIRKNTGRKSTVIK